MNSLYNLQNFIKIPRLWLPTLLILLTLNLQAQIYPAGEGWMVGVQGGMVSFFGDLSFHDKNPVKKLTKESDVGYSFMVGKQLGSFISVKAGYLNGHMRGSNPELKYAFTSKFSELNLTTELNLTKLIARSSDSRLNALALLGIGALTGKATKTSMNEGVSDPSIMSIETSDFTSEPVLITGFGLDYNMNRNWKSELRLGMRTTRNDRLDAHQGTVTNTNDYYTYLSIGMTYIITPATRLFAEQYPCSPW